MIRPDTLQRNDKVAIVAPGRRIRREDVDASVKVLESWGLNVVLSQNLFSTAHNYLAGTDDERLSDFQSALDDDTIKAIVCARGGYGSTRIVDQLDFASFIKKPKWIAGFSDVTAFLLKLSSIGYQSIHGTMPVLFANPQYATSNESLRKVLFGEDTDLTTQWHDGNKEGNAAGQVVGGNLSLIVDSLGTSSELDTTNKILLLEEIDEYLYRVDRLLTQLKRAGKLSNLAGLVIGHFTSMKDTELGFGENIEKIILNAVKDYRYPVGFGFPFGHDNPNFAWRHGSEGTLVVSKANCSLQFNDNVIARGNA